MFLDMEHEIAALAGRMKVMVLRQTLHRRTQQLLAAAANIGRRRLKSALGDKTAGGNDLRATELAVETNAHDAARPRQLAEPPPTFHRIGEVVQHAAGIDHVECPTER